jgi:hypothetical protein
MMQQTTSVIIMRFRNSNTLLPQAGKKIVNLYDNTNSNAMLLEIKKEKGRFILLNPPENASNRFSVEVSRIIDRPRGKRKGASKAYLELKELASRFPDNEFLQTSLQLFPPDYETGPDMQDDILLNEALSEKYGI